LPTRMPPLKKTPFECPFLFSFNCPELYLWKPQKVLKNKPFAVKRKSW